MSKKLFTILGASFLSAMILTSCGGDKNKEGEVKKETVRKMDAKLDALITGLAACEQQNTNCEAYTKASEGIAAMSKDSSVKNLVDDLFNGISQSTSSARSAACASAINFWVGTWDHYKNPTYGRIILDALKKEKYDDNSYVGSTLGQLLSGWLVSDDEALLKDIHAAIKNVNTEKRGRMELIRLAGKDSFAKLGLLDLLIGIANDVKESEDVRSSCLGILWRAEDPTDYQKAEDLYLAFLTSPLPAIAGTSLQGLGYMKSVKGYDKVLETVETLGADEKFCSYASTALASYIRFDAKEGIDTKKAFTLAVKMANNKTLKPFYRGYFIYSIEDYGGKEAESALAKLAAGSEKEMTDRAKEALARVKAKK